MRSGPIEWRKYASVNKARIGSDNGLLPDWHQAIIRPDNISFQKRLMILEYNTKNAYP